MLGDKKLFLLDIDGTICKGNRLIGGTKEFLSDIEKNGGKYIFITNNATRSIDDYILFFQQLGIMTRGCKKFCVYRILRFLDKNSICKISLSIF